MATAGPTDQIVQLLQQTISQDQSVRGPATQYLEELAASNVAAFLEALANVLAEESVNEYARQVAGLQFKNQLTSKDDQKRMVFQQRWLNLEQPLRDGIKQKLLVSLHTSVHSVGSTAAQAVAAVAQADLPQGQWNDLVNTLLANATNPTSGETLKQATLETIGYICEDIDPVVLTAMANPILTAIVNNMRREEPSNAVKLAATNALLNSLEFVKQNFEVEAERNFIMQVVCETTQSSDVRVVTSAFQCLVRIVSLYYNHMAFYMEQALYQLTLGAMTSAEEDVALQAVEFWSTVCDEEIGLQQQLDEGLSVECFNFAKAALAHLCPALLSLMTKQEDTDDEDIWNPATAAAVCLGLLSTSCGGMVVEHVMPFIAANITNSDWHFREAAVLAFGEVMDGPGLQDLAEICRQAMPILANLLQDSSVHVKDSAAYAIGRVCEFQPSVVLCEGTLQPVVEALGNQIGDFPRVAVNICWAFNNLFQAAAGISKDPLTEPPQTYCLSPMYQAIISQLLQTMGRQDAGQANLRYAAAEALNQAISHGPEDCYGVIQNTTLIVMEQLQASLQYQPASNTQAEKGSHSEVQGLLCGSLQAAIGRLRKEDVAKIAQQLMAMFVYMLQSPSGSGGVQEDVLLAVSALLNVLEQDFLPYVESLYQPLMNCLRDTREPGVCNNAVGIVGDLARVMQGHFVSLLQPIMESLLQTMMDTAVDRHVKVSILSCIGDIATAVGIQFAPFVEITLAALQQASEMAFIEACDYETEDYLLELRENILNGYQGIVMGLKGEQPPWHAEVSMIKGAVQKIVEFIRQCHAEPAEPDMLLRTSLGLLGELCEVFGGDMRALVDGDWTRQLLSDGSRSESVNTRNTAKWARKMIKENAGVQ